MSWRTDEGELNLLTPRICTTALAAWLLTVPAQATEWFVAPGATGNGTATSPFPLVQNGLDAARPGDIVTIRPGTYIESVRTVRNGSAAAPIWLRAEGARGSVLLTAPGRVLRVDHAYIRVEALILDGQFGAADTVDVNTGGDFLELRNVEVRRSSRDLIDIDSPRGVLIANCLIHHALNATGGRMDAHGIVASAVQDLTIRDTEIHTFSGDGIQIDPARLAPGWSGVTIERANIWLAPLPAAENGFPAGTVAGENAIDTKAAANLPRARLTIRDTTAWGFRDGLIRNMAAFNLKENVDAVVDGVTVHDSEIAFRLRGARAGPGGASVTIKNAVVHDTGTAFRYEDNIRNLKIWNSTIGNGVPRPFRAAESDSDGVEVRNLLVRGALPREAAHISNRGVGAEAFVNAAANNYALSAGASAIDAGIAIMDVKTDRAATPRPQGRAYDVGAFEWTSPSTR